MPHPYVVPDDLPASLARLLAYWRELLRGSATVPFSDDLNLADLADLKDRLMVIEVFEKPERFRLDIAGDALGATPVGHFLDEVRLAPPFDFLRSQCGATVEAAAPTYYRRRAAVGGFARLLLPLWGEGHINMVLGLVEER